MNGSLEVFPNDIFSPFRTVFRAPSSISLSANAELAWRSRRFLSTILRSVANKEAAGFRVNGFYWQPDPDSQKQQLAT